MQCGVGITCHGTTPICETMVATSGLDTVHNFSRSQDDRIELKGIDADTKAAGNQACTLIGKDATAARRANCASR